MGGLELSGVRVGPWYEQGSGHVVRDAIGLESSDPAVAFVWLASSRSAEKLWSIYGPAAESYAIAHGTAHGSSALTPTEAACAAVDAELLRLGAVMVGELEAILAAQGSAITGCETSHAGLERARIVALMRDRSAGFCKAGCSAIDALADDIEREGE